MYGEHSMAGKYSSKALHLMFCAMLEAKRCITWCMFACLCSMDRLICDEDWEIEEAAKVICLTSDWKYGIVKLHNLATELGVNPGVVAKLQRNEQQDCVDKDQALTTILAHWNSKKANDATLAALIDAFRRCELENVAVKLEKWGTSRLSSCQSNGILSENTSNAANTSNSSVEDPRIPQIVPSYGTFPELPAKSPGDLKLLGSKRFGRNYETNDHSRGGTQVLGAAYHTTSRHGNENVVDTQPRFFKQHSNDPVCHVIINNNTTNYNCAGLCSCLNL